MTVRELIRKSMLLGGIIASSEDMTNDEANDALNSLNDLIESWNTEGLLIYNSVREAFDLVAGTQGYLMGTGLAFNSSKPMALEGVSILSAGVEYPVRILTVDEWQAIQQKTIQGNIPDQVYVEENAASLKFYFYNVPNDSAADAIIYSRKPISAFSSLSDTVTLPQGYSRALRYDLAIELMQEYGKAASMVIIEKTNELKGALKRENIDGVIMNNDYDMDGLAIYDINIGFNK